jgi:chorismate mutase
MPKTDFSSCLGLDEIRKKIDQIDDQIIPLLTERFALILQLKKKTLTDVERESEILSKISSPFIQKVYRAIFKNSKKLLLETLSLRIDRR